MSGLLSSLVNTAHSLNAHAKSIEIAGKNLANVNNDNYAKQTVALSSLGTVRTSDGEQFLGLEVGAVTDSRDKVLDRQILKEIMSTNFLEGQSSFNSLIESSLGEVIDRSSGSSEIGSSDDVATSGLAANMDDFFNALQEVSADPTNSSVKSVFLEKAEIVSESFRTLDARLSSIDSDIDDAINTDVGTVNNVLQKIADLNRDINRYELGGKEQALDLRNERQGALEELAQYIDFEVVDPPAGGLGGDIKIQVNTALGAKMDLVSGRDVSNKLSYASNVISAGNPPEALNLSKGELMGYLNTKFNTLDPLRTTIDNIAKQLITSVNAAYPTDFFDADPSNFNSANIKLDSSLDVNSLTVGTGGSGSNDIALAMIAIEDQTFSTPTDYIDGTLRSHYMDQVTSMAQGFSSVDQRLEDQTLVENLLKENRSSKTSVSIDEEVTDLMRFQRAFQASSRVISILDDLLNQIVTGF